MTAGSNLKIELTTDEVLVLFDFLSREVDEKDGVALRDSVRSDAEIWALNGLLCTLEKTVWEAFDPSYSTLVSQARARITEANGGPFF